MDTVARRRKNLRKAIDALIESGKFKSDVAFCEHYDLSTSHISQMINGHGSFGERAARNLEKKVGWPNGYLDLESKDNQTINVSGSNVVPTRNDLRTIPLLDYVQAGLFHDVGYDGINPIGESYTTYQGYKPECVFSLKVEGNSMSPEFKEGDEIVVDASLEAKPGSLVIAQEVQHGIARTTFKKYRVIGVNEFGVDIIELVPLNPDFPILNSNQIEISIIGVVVAHNRLFKY
ncbi:S24 family peptidase [Acinetobacter pittii]|jgi:SOS-response transcriptional repressor LexA|uniref:LexA family protein n=1 Tax=Acinetobacter TaxID=469 RepID=UPI000450EE37|nr:MULTISPECIES: S24 family peptidase [Acinetobacter]AUT34886.1 S24 family peptidase [Acinetobacter pittii]EXA86092.1 peptidase S24-like family protein [Acinetobacter sp. 1289694]KQF52557.1 repressor [Acinetobacter pittii]MCF1279771.1 S24 family peptidase [Acinetobacter pittii]MDU1248928.1 S24 family peptidase [Acinetobacter sp.]